MAWAQEMKNLAADIRTSHRDRADRLGEIKRETKDILSEADAYIDKVGVELKEMAKDIKDFLAKSENSRKKDFSVLMGGIQDAIKEIQGEVKKIKGETRDFLTKSEEKRIAGFKDIMKDIKGDINTIKKSVADILKSTKDLIGTYATERKEAAGYWTRSKGKEAVAVEKAAAKKQKKRQNEEEE